MSREEKFVQKHILIKKKSNQKEIKSLFPEYSCTANSIFSKKYRSKIFLEIWPDCILLIPFAKCKEEFIEIIKKRLEEDI